MENTRTLAKHEHLHTAHCTTLRNETGKSNANSKTHELKNSNTAGTADTAHTAGTAGAEH